MIYMVFAEIMGYINILTNFKTWPKRVVYVNGQEGREVSLQIHNTVARYILKHYPCSRPVNTFMRTFPVPAPNPDWMISNIMFINDAGTHITLFIKGDIKVDFGVANAKKKSKPTFQLYGLHKDVLSFLCNLVNHKV